MPVLVSRLQLFSHLPASRIDLFSCGHVVSPDNVLAVTVSQGPSPVPFNFSFASRTQAYVHFTIRWFFANFASFGHLAIGFSGTTMRKFESWATWYRISARYAPYHAMFPCALNFMVDRLIIRNRRSQTASCCSFLRTTTWSGFLRSGGCVTFCSHCKPNLMLLSAVDCPKRRTKLPFAADRISQDCFRREPVCAS